MLNQYDRDTGGRDPAQQQGETLLVAFTEARGWLIKEESTRTLRQRAGDLDEALFGMRERLGGPVDALSSEGCERGGRVRKPAGGSCGLR